MKRGNVDAVKFLASQGADASARDNSGDTALHRAAFFGNVDTVKFLVSKGAEVNGKNNAGTTGHALAMSISSNFSFPKEQR